MYFMQINALAVETFQNMGGTTEAIKPGIQYVIVVGQARDLGPPAQQDDNKWHVVFTWLL
jgi:hypothetical protein